MRQVDVHCTNDFPGVYLLDAKHVYEPDMELYVFYVDTFFLFVYFT